MPNDYALHPELKKHMAAWMVKKGAAVNLGSHTKEVLLVFNPITHTTR
jgi:hypothetical protein